MAEVLDVSIELSLAGSPFQDINALFRSQVQGWQGFVAVDGTVYNWLGGAPGPGPVTQTSLEYTSTKSTFTFDVDGKVTMTVTFLSPVYPDDLARQSQQFSYITVSVQSSDGASHKVQVYTDVSGGECSPIFGVVYIKLSDPNKNGLAETFLKLSSGKQIRPVTSHITNSIDRTSNSLRSREKLRAGGTGT